ncbi:MAG: glycosyltransferase, partial [Pseudomonadota bacterium]
SGNGISVESTGKKLYELRKGSSLETKLLVGFCLMIRREVIDRIGLLDEELFLGNDDLEYSLRMRMNGFRLLIATDVFVYHKGQGSIAQLKGEEKERFERGEEARILFEKLKKTFGENNIPSSSDLWGLELFGVTPQGYLFQDKMGPKRTEAREKIRVLHVVNFLDVGGVETMLLSLLRSLNREIFDSSICCIWRKGDMAGEFEENGIRVDLIPLLKGNEIDYSEEEYQRLVEKMRGYHIIHWQWGGGNTLANRAAAEAGVPVTIETVQWPLRSRSTDVDAVVSVGDVVHRLQEGLKSMIIFNGFDSDRFTRDTRKAYDFRSPVIGRVSRLVPEKDPETFVRAAGFIQREVPEVKFLLVGGGPEERRLKSLAKQLGVDVIFTGMRRDVPELLASMDIFMYPVKNEAFGNVVAEAMAMGLPVITNRAGSMPELVLDGRTGILLDDTNPEAFADAALGLLRDPAKMKGYGKKGKEYAHRHLSSKRMVEKYEKLYIDLYEKKVLDKDRCWGKKRTCNAQIPSKMRNPSGPYKEKRVALIYDNTVRPDTTGEYCKRALERLCSVTHFLPSELDRISDGFDLYLNIDDSFKYLLPDRLRPSAWWVIDTHLQYQWDLMKARTFDYVFVAQRDGAERLRQDGIASATWLPLACDPGIHKKYRLKKRYDIAFVGNVGSGFRHELLNLIRKEFKNSFIGKVHFQEMARVYSQSRIVFNRSIKNDINMRVFEALSAGSLLITNGLDDNGLGVLFEDGNHLVTYGDGEELVKKIRYYLEREEEREKIAVAGIKEVRGKHTYERRMRTVLKECFQRERETNKSKNREKMTSVIIPTYNELEYTKRCLESLKRFTKGRYELIFVDNGSTDGTVEYLRSVISNPSPTIGYKLICNTENLGFARGCNQGIEAASGDYVLLLNNDVIVTERWLEGMIRCAESDIRAGIVGPCSNYVAGPQLDTNANYSTIEEMHSYAAQFRSHNRGRWFEVARIVGFCMLIKREVIEKVGSLDEQFGSGNYEDDDYCYRARLSGCRLMVAGDVFVHHFGSQTFIGNGIDYRKQMERNRRLFFEKWNVEPERRRRTIKTSGKLYLHSPGQKEGTKSARKVAERKVTDGMNYIGAGELEKAIRRFKDAVETDPGYSEGYNSLGCALFRMGRLQEAEESFNKAIELSEANITLWKNLGYLYLASKRYADSKRIFETVFPNNYQDMDIIMSLGQIALAENRRREAERFFSKGVAIDPEYAEAHFHLGILYKSQEQWERAEKSFRQAIAVDPKNFLPYNALGYCYIHQNREKEALDFFQRSLRLNPEQPDIREMVGNK